VDGLRAEHAAVSDQVGEQTDPVLGPAETGRDRRRDVAWYGDPVTGTQFA
jgi:hypothetical protein